jgi:hypothetical protein
VLGAARAATHVPDAAVGDRDEIMGYGKLCEGSLVVGEAATGRR